jgi:hypothetical protein
MMLMIVGLPCLQSDLSREGIPAHISVADWHHWGPAAFGDASLAANWVEGVAPVPGDNIEIAQGGSCAWNIAGSFGVFNLTAGYTKWLNISCGGSGIATTGQATLAGGIVKSTEVWYSRGGFSVANSAIIYSPSFFNLMVDTNDGQTIDFPWVDATGAGVIGNVNFAKNVNVVNLCARSTMLIGSSKTVTVSGHLGVYQETAGTYTNLGTIAGTGDMTYLWTLASNKSMTFGNVSIPVIFESVVPGTASTFVRLATNTVFGSSLTINTSLHVGYAYPIILYPGTGDYSLTVRGLTTLGDYARIVPGNSFFNLTGGLKISGTNAKFFGFTTTAGYLNTSAIHVDKGLFNATGGKVKATNVTCDSPGSIVFPEYTLTGTFPATHPIATNYSQSATIREGSVGVNYYNLSGNATWLKIHSSNATKITLWGFPSIAGIYNISLRSNDSFSTVWENWTITVSSAIPMAPWYWTNGNYLAYAATYDFDENGVARQAYNGTWIYNPYSIGRLAGEIYHNWYDTGNTAGLPMFWDQINWMMAHENITGNHSLWLCNYTLGRAVSPVASALGQAWVITCLMDAYAITQNSSYLDSVWRGVLSFGIPMADDGLVSIWNGTVWYEEEAKSGGIVESDPSHIFNGMQFAMSGLYYLYEYNSSTLAKSYFDLGVAAVKAHYGDFDTGMWQKYAMNNIVASVGYMGLHKSLADWMFAQTADPFFQWESERIVWELDMISVGYTISGLWASNNYGASNISNLKDKSITTGGYSADVNNVNKYVNIIIDLGAERPVNYFGYYGASYTYCPRNWTLYSSKDNVSWASEAAVFNLTETFKLFLFSDPAFETRYFRLNISETISGYFVAALVEIIVGSMSDPNLVFAADSFSHPYFNSTLGRLNLTIPTGFSVSINGGPNITSNQSLELSDGTYQLDCADNYGQTRTLLVSVKFGLTTLINVSSGLFPQIVVPPPDDDGNDDGNGGGGIIDDNGGIGAGWLLIGGVVAVGALMMIIVIRNSRGRNGPPEE